MATTTNYGWTTPDDTALVKDGAAAIRTLGSSVDTTTKALNPSTTLGDIEYRSSTANTNTRLGIGSTGQVLTVAGGVPSWATASGTLSIANIASGSFSGTSVTISSLTQDFMQLNMKGIRWNTGASQLRIRLNNDSSGLYDFYGFEISQQPLVDKTNVTNQTGIVLTPNANADNAVDMSFCLTLQNCKSTGFTTFTLTGNYSDSDPTKRGLTYSGIYKASAQITSISIATFAGYTFNAGTYDLNGA
jgi:hypothetical protein